MLSVSRPNVASLSMDIIQGFGTMGAKKGTLQHCCVQRHGTRRHTLFSSIVHFRRISIGTHRCIFFALFDGLFAGECPRGSTRILYQ